MRRDEGSLPFALLVSMIGLTLSALLMPLVILQAGAGRIESRRIDEVGAAQAGMDVALGHVRAAYTGTAASGAPAGDLSKLPCAALSGVVGSGTEASYRVTVDYFSFEPSPTDYLDVDGSYDDGWIDANKLPCGTGSPRNVLIRSQGRLGLTVLTGACSADARCLRATYAFAANVAGGLIHVYKTPTSSDMCLAAPDDTPSGDGLTIATCRADDWKQLFGYADDLTLVLVGSRSSAQPAGLCLDSRTTPGTAVVFQPCTVADRPTQRWIYTSDTAFVSPAGTCLRVASPDLNGGTVVHDQTAHCTDSAYSNVADFTPEATVGTGVAGSANGQLVNKAQYARCLAVTRQDYLWHTGSGTPALNDGPYLIAWPCKQTNPAGWDQTWTVPAAGASGLITTTSPAVDPAEGSPPGRYCLRSPASAAAQQYVKIVSCLADPSPATHMTWTVAAASATDAGKYVIRDDSVPQLCLAPQTTAARTADPYPFTDGTGISKIVVQTCDGSDLQKWNASATKGLALFRIGER